MNAMTRYTVIFVSLLFLLTLSVRADDKADIQTTIDTLLRGVLERDYALMDSVCDPDGSILTHYGLERSWKELKAMLPELEQQYAKHKDMLKMIDNGDMVTYFWMLTTFDKEHAKTLEEIRATFASYDPEVLEMLKKSMTESRKAHEKVISYIDFISPYTKSIELQDFIIQDDVATVSYTAAGARGPENSDIVLKKKGGRWVIHKFNFLQYEEAGEKIP